MRRVLISIICVLVFAVPAFADSNHDTINNYNAPITVNQNPTATATSSATGGAGGAGGSVTVQKDAFRNTNENSIGNGFGNFSPTASATIQKGAIENNNANVNFNTNKQAQGQVQGQAQKQGQFQGQNNDQVIAPSQEITIINPENKRDLPGFYGYQAPGVGDYRGPYEKGIQGKAKPWTLKQEWGKEEIEGFYSMSDSATCKVFTVKKIREATDALKVAKEGPISCILECYGDSGFELWGTAGKKAMECGAKAISEEAFHVNFANKSSGWNFGFGGGVTAINGGNDNFGGSVGGGTGIGSVTTGPVEKVKAIFIAY